MGDSYFIFLTEQLFSASSGNADLCSFFLLRANELVNTHGCIGFVATSAISEGDTRETGLNRLLRKSSVIIWAETSRTWPGAASVTYSLLWITRGPWTGNVVLDGESVSKITAFLTPQGTTSGKPMPLRANTDISYIGSYVLGTGFVMPHDQDPKRKSRVTE